MSELVPADRTAAHAAGHRPRAIVDCDGQVGENDAITANDPAQQIQHHPQLPMIAAPNQRARLTIVPRSNHAVPYRRAPVEPPRGIEST